MKKNIYIQDGPEYHKILDGDSNRLLNLAANCGIVLYAALKPHSAVLKAQHWVKSPKKSSRTCQSCIVPIVPATANDLLLFQEATVRNYFAADTDDENHPWYGHYFVLDDPQKISLEQVFYKAKSTTDSSQEISDCDKDTHILWDIDMAIKKITYDGLLDTTEEMKKPEYYINQKTRSCIQKFGQTIRFQGMFETAVKIGQIKDPDTPANWIAWAEKKGFDTSHLNTYKTQLDENDKPSNKNIPGKLPNTGVGKCAIRAAWELEQELKRHPTDEEVMARLQNWAKNADEPDILLEPNRGNVMWLTKKGRKKEYKIDNLGTALKNWYISRKSGI